MNLIPVWLVAVIALSTGALSGGAVVRNHYLVEIADLQADQDKAVVAAYQSGVARLEAAQARGNTLSADLAQREAEIDKLTLEVTRAAKRHTTGRTCLDAAAVRVLNRADPGPVATDVPQAAGAPVAQSAGAATDTDIYEWIAAAWGYYATCRGRLGALIDWEEGAPR